MKIIALVENTSRSSEYRSKHGICLYVETAKHRLLFDLGSDHLFIENARKLGVDIESIDTVVISHGHNDHGGALQLFLQNNSKANIYIRKTAFMPYYTKVFGIPVYVGLDKSLAANERIIFTEENYEIDDELQLFSNITERECYPTSNRALFVKSSQGYVNDTFGHEQNLIITENDKTLLLAGCAHNGIINIQNKAEHITGQEISYVISGFHLYNPVSKKGEREEFILEIASRLHKKNTQYYTCHCTGTRAFTIMQNMLEDKIKYLSTGDSIDI